MNDEALGQALKAIAGAIDRLTFYVVTLLVIGFSALAWFMDAVPYERWWGWPLHFILCSGFYWLLGPLYRLTKRAAVPPGAPATPRRKPQR